MASFAEGLAQGLMRNEEMELRRGSDRRAEAISLAQLANQADELEYKRQQRKREEDFRQGMSNLYSNIYAPEVEEKVPVKGAAIQGAPGQAPVPEQFETRKVRKNFSMGERSEEGRARDLQYMMGYTKLMIDNGKISPEMMKQSMEFSRYLEQEGLKDSMAALMLNPGDQKAAGVLAKRFNLDPKTVAFEVVTKDDQNKPLAIPRFVLNAVGTNGAKMQYDVSNALQAIGVSTFADIQKNAGANAQIESGVARDKALTDKTVKETNELIPAQISASNAQTSNYNANAKKTDQETKLLVPAQAAYYNAKASAEPTKAELKRGTEYDIFNKAAQSSLGNKGPVLPWQVEIPGKGLDKIDDTRGSEIINTIGTRMLDAGVAGGEAWRRTQDIMSKLNQAALKDVDTYHAQLKANPEKFGTTKEMVNRQLADPNFRINGFNEYRNRRLEQLLKQQKQ